MTRRALFLAPLIAASLSLSGVAFAQTDAGGDPAYPLPALVFTTESFNDSTGISGNPFEGYYVDGPFAGAGVKDRMKARKRLTDLGVRYYRAALRFDLTRPEQPADMLALYNETGMRPMMLLDPRKSGNPQEFVALLKPYAPGLIAEIEAPNEVNNKFPPQ